MKSRKYEDFLKDEKWRGKEVRFGMNQVSLNNEIIRLKSILGSYNNAPKFIAEFGCGTALHLIDICKEFQDAECWGFEPAENMFGFARENLESSEFKNIKLARFIVEDIPEKFFNRFDLTFSILVGSFSEDLGNYYEAISRLSCDNSIHFLMDFVLPPNMNESEKMAMDDYLANVINVQGLQDKDGLLNVLRAKGFTILDDDDDNYRYDDSRASDILSRKDPHRRKLEEEICRKNGLKDNFISSMIFVKKIIAVKKKRV